MLNQIIGGIGLFLLGMILLTDGLKAMAGEALRRTLVRFTGGPVRAMASGAAATAVLQSSSATVVTTIGFVSAGLLTFPQAVGVILGANLGTTSTGWIVSLVGLKLSLGTVALPVVTVGALLRLLARGRLAHAGGALAGFGLIFVGIDTMQAGMEVLATRIDPAAFPGESFRGRILLVGVGVVMTVLMQSSSAAIATTLTALHSGAVEMNQAAALVIGQSIGTTVTAAIAAVGGSTAARRTALAHILFNVIAGVIAFALLPALPRIERALLEGGAGYDPATMIAGFQTSFKLIGVLVILPLARPFSELIERLSPDRGPVLTRHLDPTVARVPEVGIDAARRTVGDVMARLVELLSERLTHPARTPDQTVELEAIVGALRETGRFLGLVQGGDAGEGYERELGVLHALDHAERLAMRVGETGVQLTAGGGMAEDYLRMLQELSIAGEWLRNPTGPPVVRRLAAFSEEVADRRRTQRVEHLRATAARRMEPEVALAEIEAMRWLDACAYHLWRAVNHLEEALPRSAA